MRRSGRNGAEGSGDCHGSIRYHPHSSGGEYGGPHSSLGGGDGGSPDNPYGGGTDSSSSYELGR